MFDGIKLLCLSPGTGRCLEPLIVPEQQYLKIANTGYRCPACGYESGNIKDYFLKLTQFKQRCREFNETELALLDCFTPYDYDGGDGLDLDVVNNHLIESDDWHSRNMQIANFTVRHQRTFERAVIWEDHFYKARPHILPGVSEDSTFSEVLSSKTFAILTAQIHDLAPLVKLIEAIRNYNTAWLGLIASCVTTAPLSLVAAPEPQESLQRPGGSGLPEGDIT